MPSARFCASGNQHGRVGIARADFKIESLELGLAQRIDQRRADHHAIGVFSDGAGLIRGPHPKADRDRLLSAREGFGRKAEGGYAGETCHVTTGADSGTGWPSLLRT